VDLLQENTLIDWKKKCDKAGIEFDDFEERAAIKEYDAGMPRGEAEWEAFKELTEKKESED